MCYTLVLMADLVASAGRTASPSCIEEYARSHQLIGTGNARRSASQSRAVIDALMRCHHTRTVSPARPTLGASVCL